MGTMELALPKLVEILSPEGQYEKRRIALRAEYSAVVTEAQKITVIDSAEAAEEATKFGRLLQVASKETETFFKSVKVQVDAIKAPILDAEKADVGPYNKEKLRLGTLQSVWDQKVLREKEEADRKAREAAEAQAREDALQRAIEMESIGDVEAAEQILSEPIVAAPVVTLLRSQSRPTGSVNRGMTFKGEVTNLMDLVRAIAVGRAPLGCLLANESFINKLAEQYQDAFSIPGVKLVKSIPPTSYRR